MREIGFAIRALQRAPAFAIVRVFLAAAALVCLAALGYAVQAQSGANQALQKPPMLAGRSPSDVRAIMDGFNKALGVECAHCHVQDKWRDASKPELAVARGMYEMVAFVNANQLADLQHVACITCHAGHTKPTRLPRDRLTTAESQWPASLPPNDPRKLTMAVYAASLGVNCEHCHSSDDWKSSAKPAFQLVSRMNAMFSVFPKYMPPTALTQCWMCHQGAVKPAREKGH